jgi:hypothetical protein
MRKEDSEIASELSGTRVAFLTANDLVRALQEQSLPA